MYLKRLRIPAMIGAALIVAACTAPAAPAPTPQPAEATAVVPAAPTAVPAEATVEPTAAPTEAPAEPTAAPTEAPAEPTESPAAIGANTDLVFLTFGPERPEIVWRDAAELGVQVPVAGTSGVHPSYIGGDVQVVGNRAYLAQDGLIYEYLPDGRRTPLEFTRLEGAMPGAFRPFLVSPSGRQIAWVDAQFWEGPGTKSNVLKVANIDGSNARVVLELGEDQSGFLQPLGWNEAAGLLYVGMQPVWTEAYVARDFPGAFNVTQVGINGEDPVGDEIIDVANCGERACILGVAPSGLQFAQVEYGENGSPTRLIVGDAAPGGGALVWDLPAGLREVGYPTWLEEDGKLAFKALPQDEVYQILVADLQTNELDLWWQGEDDLSPRIFAGPDQLLVTGKVGGPIMGAPPSTYRLSIDGTVELVAEEMPLLGSGTTE